MTTTVDTSRSAPSPPSSDGRSTRLRRIALGLTTAVIAGVAIVLVTGDDEPGDPVPSVPPATDAGDEVTADDPIADGVNADRPSAEADPSTVVDAADRSLQWSPPEGWEDFERLEIGSEGGRFRLESGVDYQVSATQTVTGPVEIIGGRDVVWVGGAIVIDRQADVTEPVDRAIGLIVRDDDDSASDEDDPRVVHLEGLLFDGSGLNEGIDVDAPSAIVQIQNVRIEDVIFASADDRDGTGPYAGKGRNHPDLVQTFGGHTELRIDGLSGRSGYQGLFLKIDHDDGRGGEVRLRNVDIRATEFTGVDGFAYAGNRMYFWDSATIGNQFIETGTVWVEHHPDAGKVADNPNPRPGSGSWWQGAFRDGDRLVAEAPPGSARPADAVERLSSGEQVVQPKVRSDEFGQYVWWPLPDSDDVPAVLDDDGDQPGRIHIGRPPAGPYVPRDFVGTGYRSPGYESGAEDSG